MPDARIIIVRDLKTRDVPAIASEALDLQQGHVAELEVTLQGPAEHQPKPGAAAFRIGQDVGIGGGIPQTPSRPDQGQNGDVDQVTSACVTGTGGWPSRLRAAR